MCKLKWVRVTHIWKFVALINNIKLDKIRGV